jgi:hypothetical protein
MRCNVCQSVDGLPAEAAKFQLSPTMLASVKSFPYSNIEWPIHGYSHDG